jgi:hypothetical protein
MSPNGKPGIISSFTTSTYKMHFFQTATGYMFVLMTSPGVGNLTAKFQKFFREVFLPTVVMNPLYKLDTPIALPPFEIALEKFNWDSK